MMSPPQAPIPNAGAPGTAYEFDDRENATLRSLSTTMRIAAGLTLLQGAAAVAQSLWLARAFSPTAVAGAAVGLVVGVVLNLFMGVWTLSAAAAIERVVTTRGDDIPNLMTAVVKLGQLFAVLRVLCMLLLVLLVLVCVGAMALAVR